ncbi:thioredoxin-dependent thiol peroxidase [Spirochaeta cellobiosiphila]|uniref:thioredoxin-dependent thiol peroxidase n=1 Tax=Spirochaeta cellobiosiphila TaxID=504483 RepID=UPI00040DECF5|nr:thioredoxin-dependent thiol peroxidase [Spirochaeta cellobiosiphila]
MLELGQQAPDFELSNQNGTLIKLSEYKGKKVVLYFYPKDNTPGCTKEACSLRAGYEAISQTGTVILGVSPDSTTSHQKFIDKFDLPFDLLSDPDHKVMEQYDAWGEKNMYGKVVVGVKRSTFLIDEEGKIFKIFKKVKTASHNEEILPFL